MPAFAAYIRNAANSNAGKFSDHGSGRQGRVISLGNLDVSSAVSCFFNVMHKSLYVIEVLQGPVA
jgi:hypothetical protein